ncbi:MAG: hypothetical protein R6V16_00540, partial [Bacteroidales bacterium]
SRANYWGSKRADNRKKYYPDLTLYEEILFLKHWYDGLWNIENVIPYYDPLIHPTSQIGRHLFWSSFKIPGFKNTWSYMGSDRCSDLEPLFGYDLKPYKLHKKLQVLRNAVQPELGLHILNLALDIKSQEQTEQKTLFDD